MKRLLVLEDGSIYEGRAIGSDNFKVGELIFNTSIAGYQEVFTDLASAGEIVVMTYPLIGNCGINRDDYESISPSVFGIVIKDECQKPSNWRCQESLEDFLQREDIPGICDVDTRALVAKLTTSGTMKATFANIDEDIEEVIKKLQTAKTENLVSKVASDKSFSIPGEGKRVVIIDFGVKLSILREMSRKGFDLIVLPYDIDAKTVMSFVPDAVFLSNGPGDPRDLSSSIETVRELLNKTVIFGVGLGCDILALASGAKVSKMHVGHHGNHPVLNKKDGRVIITNQNHAYEIDPDSLNATELQITHTALNDGSIEGIAHKRYKAFGVEFYPDTNTLSHTLYDDFKMMIEKENQDA